MDRKCPWRNLAVSQCNRRPHPDHERVPVEMMAVLNAMAIMAIAAAMVEGGMMIEAEKEEEEEEIQIMDVPMPILDGVVLLLVEVLLVVVVRLTHAMVVVEVVVAVIDMEEASPLVLETVAVIVVVVVPTLLVGEEVDHPPLETRLAPRHHLREKDHV